MVYPENCGAAVYFPSLPERELFWFRRRITVPESLPLQSTSIRSKILAEGPAVETQITQTFVHPGGDFAKGVKEAEFVFPQDPDASVVEFQVTVDGELTQSCLLPLDKATQAYETARDQLETGAFQLQKSRANEGGADMFKIKLANIESGSIVTVFLRIIGGGISIQDGRLLKYTIPMILTPRYSPTSSKAPMFTSCKRTSRDPKKFIFTCEVETSTGNEFVKIASPSHSNDLTIDYKGTEMTSAQVELISTQSHLDRDIVLLFEMKNPNSPKLLWQPVLPQLAEATSSSKGKEHSVGSVAEFSFTPLYPPDYTKSPSQIVFAIDCSGSMGGRRIKKAREALKVFTKSLPPDCSVNVFRFGSYHTSWQPKAVKLSDGDHAASLEEYVEGTQADMGGTEIYRCLNGIQQSLDPEFCNTAIFLLTDGDVSNQRDVIEFVASMSSTSTFARTRLFSLGIGDGASTSLVKGCARAGYGTAQFVKDKESPQMLNTVVVTQLQLALAESVTDVTLEWSMVDDTQGVVQQAAKSLEFLLASRSRPHPLLLKLEEKATSHQEATVEQKSDGKVAKSSEPASLFQPEAMEHHNKSIHAVFSAAPESIKGAQVDIVQAAVRSAKLAAEKYPEIVTGLKQGARTFIATDVIVDPVIFSGHNYTAHCFVPAGKRLASVTLRGKLGQQDVVMQVNAPLSPTGLPPNKDTAAKLDKEDEWVDLDSASEKIVEVSKSSLACLGAQAIVTSAAHAIIMSLELDSTKRNMAESLGLIFQLQSENTSFVAIDNRRRMIRQELPPRHSDRFVRAPVYAMTAPVGAPPPPPPAPMMAMPAMNFGAGAPPPDAFMSALSFGAPEMESAALPQKKMARAPFRGTPSMRRMNKFPPVQEEKKTTQPRGPVVLLADHQNPDGSLTKSPELVEPLLVQLGLDAVPEFNLDSAIQTVRDSLQFQDSVSEPDKNNAAFSLLFHKIFESVANVSELNSAAVMLKKILSWVTSLCVPNFDLSPSLDIARDTLDV